MITNGCRPILLSGYGSVNISSAGDVLDGFGHQLQVRLDNQSILSGQTLYSQLLICVYFNQVIQKLTMGSSIFEV